MSDDVDVALLERSLIIKERIAEMRRVALKRIRLREYNARYRASHPYVKKGYRSRHNPDAVAAREREAQYRASIAEGRFHGSPLLDTDGLSELRDGRW